MCLEAKSDGQQQQQNVEMTREEILREKIMDLLPKLSNTGHTPWVFTFVVKCPSGRININDLNALHEEFPGRVEVDDDEVDPGEYEGLLTIDEFKFLLFYRPQILELSVQELPLFASGSSSLDQMIQKKFREYDTTERTQQIFGDANTLDLHRQRFWLCLTTLRSEIEIALDSGGQTINPDVKTIWNFFTFLGGEYPDISLVRAIIGDSITSIDAAHEFLEALLGQQAYNQTPEERTRWMQILRAGFNGAVAGARNLAEDGHYTPENYTRQKAEIMRNQRAQLMEILDKLDRLPPEIRLKAIPYKIFFEYANQTHCPLSYRTFRGF